MINLVPNFRTALLITLSTLCLNACTHSIQDDWVDLFDGQSLKGWTQVGGSASYTVVDNSIRGTTVSDSPNSFLVSELQYGNFILEFEFKLSGRTNSGVQFRSQSKHEIGEGRIHGYQFEIDPSARAWTAGIYDEWRRGWIYPLELNPNAQTSIEINTWYHGRIEAQGNDIKTFLNGRAVAHLIDSKKIESQGIFALQVHSIGGNDTPGTHVYWRKLRLTQHVDKYSYKNTPSIFTKRIQP